MWQLALQFTHHLQLLSHSRLKPHMYSADENIKFQRQTGTFAPLDPTSIDRATLLRKVSKNSVDFANLRAFTSSESNDLTSTEATITCFNYGSSLGLDTDEDRAVVSICFVDV